MTNQSMGEAWDWDAFVGSSVCLNWNRAELANLNKVLELTPGRRAVVQAGGNLGVFAKRLAEEFEAVYTFEPDPAVFASLMRNVPEENVFKFPAALGCERQLVQTSNVRRVKTHMPTHEGITYISGLNGVIPTLKIDDLGLNVCDLIYLDIEGYEFFALQGAIETITKLRPILAVEVKMHAKFMGYTGEDLTKLISSLGYEFKEIFGADHVFIPK